MKIRELLESIDDDNHELWKWSGENVDAHDFGVTFNKNNGFIEIVRDDGGTVYPHTFTLAPHFNHETPTFKTPSFVKSDAWEKWPGIILKHYNIDEYSQIPNVKTLNFTNCHISTFNGIEKLDKVKSLILHFTEQDFHITCPVLRLLKMPRLENFVNFQDALPMKVGNIIDKHLKEKNIPECQQELIEEGFEEFAKL